MSNEFHLELFEGAQSSGHPCTCDIGEDHPPTPSVEMKDLAARMAADEANEGNYAAAAELQAAADRANAEIQRLHGPVDDAPTGPLTPGQVPCRVCQLDDRTRAASSPDDLLCNVCRADEPNRIRQLMLEDLRHALENLFGMTDELRDDETTAGVAERELICERVGAVMKLAALAESHMLPNKLVSAPKRVEELEANERTRQFVEKSLDRLKPRLVRRIADVICPPLEVSADEVRGWSQLQIDEWAAIQRAAREAAERLVEKGLRFVPSDAEIEAAVAQIGYVIAGPDTIPGTPLQLAANWDGKVYMEIDDELRESLLRCRETYDDWGVFGLVRVPDETLHLERVSDRD